MCPNRLFTSAILLAIGFCTLATAQDKTDKDQSGKAESKTSVIKGQIELRDAAAQTWDGKSLKLAYPEMKARLREIVELPPPPFPAQYNQWTPKQRQEWQIEFAQTEQGKAIIERNKKLLEEANSFDIKFESDGSFVVYDVPAGAYGIQGRLDKEVDGTTYAYEVFGQLEVKADVDEVALAPMQLEITPILKRGDQAPPIKVSAYDEKPLSDDMFKNKVLLISFWTSQTPTAKTEQANLQQVYSQLKDSHDLHLLCINIDEDQKQAVQFLLANQLRDGSHGFTAGFDHPTLRHYGVRGVPSFWMIDKQGKILMSQFEFAQAMRLQPELTTIVANRIEGKDTPTPADPPGDGD